jgi:hypothetical protein
MTFLIVERPLRLNNNYLMLLWVAAIGYIMVFPACQLRKAATLHECVNDMVQLKITSLSCGSFCGIEYAGDIIITSGEDWANLWEKVHLGIYPKKQLPQVDFSRETVLAVFMGTRSTGGYSIEITRAHKKNGVINAVVETSSPAPGDLVTTVITQPFHIVKINTAEKDIEIVRE